MNFARTATLLAAAALLVSGCMNGGILRAAAPTPRPTLAPSPAAPPVVDPLPLAFPRDEGPHQRLTEWWYYTGHLEAADGRRVGFEFVVFRAERGDFPVAWASHFAITDAEAGTFRYEQRSEVGPQVDRSPGEGFGLSIQPDASAAPWTMSGAGGRDRLGASGSPGSIVLDLSTDRPPVLHDGDGWIDLGPAGGTYYYSRTRMELTGTFTSPDGEPVAVRGLAWFDHQWGDFIAVGAGGWDWFSVQLDDGRDLTLSLVRGSDGETVLAYGTLVAAGGDARHIAAGDFHVTVLDRWQSPRSGADYPAAWRIELPDEGGDGLVLNLRPTLADQELDTTHSTGVTYWEGEVSVTGTDGGSPVAGQGYVELTGYAG